MIYNEKDALEIEDAFGRVKFIFAKDATLNEQHFRATDLPYGIVIGLVGYYDNTKHHFVAEKVFLPEMPQQRQLNLSGEASHRKMLVISEPSTEQIKKILTEIVDYEYEKVKK